MAIKVTCETCGASFRTDDSSAGKQASCPKCGGAIQIPFAGQEHPAPEQDVYEAEDAGFGSFSDDELTEGAVVPGGSGGDDRRPCPMCGEMIVRDAVKCRYCGEIFDSTLRKRAKKSKAKSEDADLSAGEWVLAILCSGIGCILGIIWIVQGKPKGTKMLIVSLIASAVGTVIRIAIEAANH